MQKLASATVGRSYNSNYLKNRPFNATLFRPFTSNREQKIYEYDRDYLFLLNTLSLLPNALLNGGGTTGKLFLTVTSLFT